MQKQPAVAAQVEHPVAGNGQRTGDGPTAPVHGAAPQHQQTASRQTAPAVQQPADGVVATQCAARKRQVGDRAALKVRAQTDRAP